MFLRWSSFLIIFSIIVIQISYIYSTPVVSGTVGHINDENDDDYQRAYNGVVYYIKSIMEEKNVYEQTMLINQLREYLNRICVFGFFGPSHAEACQRVVDILHQNHSRHHTNDDESLDASNETHGIQKRFFCNGFIGCKSGVSG